MGFADLFSVTKIPVPRGKKAVVWCEMRNDSLPSNVDAQRRHNTTQNGSTPKYTTRKVHLRSWTTLTAKRVVVAQIAVMFNKTIGAAGGTSSIERQVAMERVAVGRWARAGSSTRWGWVTVAIAIGCQICVDGRF